MFKNEKEHHYMIADITRIISEYSHKHDKEAELEAS